MKLVDFMIKQGIENMTSDDMQQLASETAALSDAMRQHGIQNIHVSDDGEVTIIAQQERGKMISDQLASEILGGDFEEVDADSEPDRQFFREGQMHRDSISEGYSGEMRKLMETVKPLFEAEK